MTTVQDIIQYKESEEQKILSVCKSIHPKLTSFIMFQDINDDSLMNDDLKTRYDRDIVPLLKQYKDTLRSMKMEFLIQYFQQYMEIGIIDAPGVDLNTGNQILLEDLYSNEIDFFPELEVQAMYYRVLEYGTSLNHLEPFWCKTAQYTISSENLKITAAPADSPSKYMKSLLYSFGDQGYKNESKRLMEYCTALGRLPYSAHVPALSQYDERQLKNSGIIVAAQNHLKLHDFLESGKDMYKKYYCSQKDQQYRFVERK